MKLNDRLYDILKWIALICIPALATFYVALAGVWGWPYADEVSKTANAVCVLLGALIGISTAEYRKNERALSVSAVGADSSPGGGAERMEEDRK